MRSDTKTIIGTLEILAHDIQTDDGVANSCLMEAAQRLRELSEWRPIDEKTTKLPENMFFLVATKDRNVLHTKEFATLPAKEAFELLRNCTHWMPLPDAPEVV